MPARRVVENGLRWYESAPDSHHFGAGDMGWREELSRELGSSEIAGRAVTEPIEAVLAWREEQLAGLPQV